MTRKEKAIELHDKGFNCAQAVACAFAEETGIPAWAAWQQPVVRYPAQSCLRD